MMLCASGIVGLEVDAERDGDVRLLRGRRDDHLLRSRLQVLLGIRAGAEASAGLDHDVDAEIVPRAARPGRSPSASRSGPVDDDRAVDSFDGAVEGAVDGVVLQQLSEHRRVGDVVDRQPTRCLRPTRSAARNAARPVRPKPLMATRTAMTPPLFEFRSDGRAVRGPGHRRIAPPGLRLSRTPLRGCRRCPEGERRPHSLHERTHGRAVARAPAAADAARPPLSRPTAASSAAAPMRRRPA